MSPNKQNKCSMLLQNKSYLHRGSLKDLVYRVDGGRLQKEQSLTTSYILMLSGGFRNNKIGRKIHNDLRSGGLQ